MDSPVWIQLSTQVSGTSVPVVGIEGWFRLAPARRMKDSWATDSQLGHSVSAGRASKLLTGLSQIEATCPLDRKARDKWLSWILSRTNGYRGFCLGQMSNVLDICLLSSTWTATPAIRRGGDVQVVYFVYTS
jgi:hypothetical protein